MSDLIERLKAALDEDERVALDALADVGTGPTPDLDADGRLVIGDWALKPSVAAHVLRHAPNRVLRQVAAIRMILEVHEHVRIGEDRIGCRGCGMDSEWGLHAMELDEQQACSTVLALAEAYGVALDS